MLVLTCKMVFARMCKYESAAASAHGPNICPWMNVSLWSHRMESGFAGSCQLHLELRHGVTVEASALRTNE